MLDKRERLVGVFPPILYSETGELSVLLRTFVLEKTETEVFCVEITTGEKGCCPQFCLLRFYELNYLLR